MTYAPLSLLIAELGGWQRVARAFAFPEHQTLVHAFAGKVSDDRFCPILGKACRESFGFDLVGMTDDDDRSDVHIALGDLFGESIELRSPLRLEHGSTGVECAVTLRLRLKTNGSDGRLRSLR